MPGDGGGAQVRLRAAGQLEAHVGGVARAGKRHAGRETHKATVVASVGAAGEVWL